jgi:hypothetical protein
MICRGAGDVSYLGDEFDLGNVNSPIQQRVVDFRMQGTLSREDDDEDRMAQRGAPGNDEEAIADDEALPLDLEPEPKTSGDEESGKTEQDPEASL